MATHPLAAYLKKRDLTIGALAKATAETPTGQKHKLSPGAIRANLSAVLQGKRKGFRATTCEALSEATKGEVSAWDIVSWSPEKNEEKQSPRQVSRTTTRRTPPQRGGAR